MAEEVAVKLAAVASNLLTINYLMESIHKKHFYSIELSPSYLEPKIKGLCLPSTIQYVPGF